MKQNRVLFLMIFSLILLPLFTHSTLSLNRTLGYAENVKIGFSWINGINGASELIDVGYTKAVEMGAQIEHREYRWDYLNYTISPIYEWQEVYLNRHPEIESSIALAVINGNSSCLPININFTPYTLITENITRFNDPLVVNALRNTTIQVLSALNASYISFGNEINYFFKIFYDNATQTFTSTTMLEDYVNLYQQLYDFIRTNYSDISVLTTFGYQTSGDFPIIETILPYFVDTCDIFGLSSRIFADRYGRIAILNETEVLTRFTSFANLTDKKIAITNTYTISDSRAEGSEKYQANYVHYLFNAIKNLENKLEFVCWYTIFDYPPGYLSMFFSPFLEPHATAGLLTQLGDPKLSYYAWINEMIAAGKLPNYKLSWKVAIASLVIVAVVGFVIFNYVMEGIQFPKEKLKRVEDEKMIDSKEIVLEEKKMKTIKEEKSEIIEFTTANLTGEKDDIGKLELDE